MTGPALAAVQGTLLLALLWPKPSSEATAAARYIPADWGAGVALTLMYAAVMLGVMALWARGWKIVPLSPAAAEQDPSWMRGPYRFIRHPMRLALLAIALGWCLVYRDPANLLILGLLAAVTLIDSRRDDAALAADGGPILNAWLERVRGFLPGLY